MLVEVSHFGIVGVERVGADVDVDMGEGELEWVDWMVPGGGEGCERDSIRRDEWLVG